MIDLFSNGSSWLDLPKVFWVNVALSVDNAVVIALAARALPPRQQRLALLLGAGCACALRIAATLSLALVAALPWVRLIGALVLLWIGVKLLTPAPHHAATMQSHSLHSAVGIIAIADLTMSLDNILAVYSAADGATAVIVIGLALSIPLMILASGFMLELMRRLPLIVVVGGALIGFVAGELSLSDAALRPWLEQCAAADCVALRAQPRMQCIAAALGQWQRIAGLIGAAAVVSIGSLLARRARRATAAAPIHTPGARL